jgi:hypothetical protein
MRRKSITTYPRSAGNKRDGEARAVLQRQIYQVIVNLATNAATPSATRFDQHKGGCAAWTSAGTLERIFDPFLYDQADGKGNWPRPLGGAPNITSHGGTVRVYSEPGKGTAFHVYFLAITSAVEAREAIPQPLVAGSGQRILFVDDEALKADETGQVGQSDTRCSRIGS